MFALIYILICGQSGHAFTYFLSKKKKENIFNNCMYTQYMENCEAMTSTHSFSYSY